METQNPPLVNGIMTTPPCTKTDLQAIINAFQATLEQVTADTFYVVSEWNKQNPTKTINGDTAQFVMGQV